MSSTTNLMRPVLGSLLVAALIAACGSSENNPQPDAPAAMCMPSATAPTYTQLYNQYFADNTPGNCAEENCHGQTAFNVWSCGNSKDTCFNGMVNVGLIDTSNALRSRIGNTSTSPIIWVNPQGGFMPADNFGPNNAGRDAIIAWMNACAPNN